MSKPVDLLKSLVRNAADFATSSVTGLEPVTRVRSVLKDLVNQRIHVKQSTLTNAVAHLPGVESAQVSARDEGLFVDVAFSNGDQIQAVLHPERVRFAPRGAKEVTFRVEPEQQATSHHITDIASAIGGAIALALWPLVRDVDHRDVSGAIVDREGRDRLTVDLRTAPAVRSLDARGRGGVIVEVLELGALEVTNGSLVLTLVLPKLAP